MTGIECEKIIWQDQTIATRDAETVAFFGGELYINGIQFPPVTLGTITLAEMFEVDLDFSDPTDGQNLLLILYLIKQQKNAVKSNRSALQKLANQIGKFDELELIKILKTIFQTALTGFALMPQGAKSETPLDGVARYYDAEWLSNIVIVVHKSTGLLPEQIIWTTPLTAVGFYYAATAKANGVKNIKRQPNIAALRAAQKAELIKNEH